MINAIFAVDQNGGMGFNGTLPWPHNSEDLQYFKEQTLGDIVIMGRRSWDDPKLPKPLPGRTTFVVTNRNNVGYGAVAIGGDVAAEIQKIAAGYPEKTIWIIGGVNLLEQTRDIVDNVHLTHFKGSYKVDTRIDLKRYLTGFVPKQASVSQDRQSTRIVYKNEDLFRRT